MKIAIVVFPGSNCDRDISWAIKKISGKKPDYLWHKEKKFTNAILKFIDWIANGKQEEVSEAIELNMKKYFINKTSDDCSISIIHISIIKSLFDKISDYFKN